MAKIVLGIGTSHSPMLALNSEQWRRYAKGDLQHTGLVFPPDGISMTYEEGLAHVPTAIRERPLTDEVFEEQSAACQRGIAELVKTIAEVDPDVTVIISDDQDEWFFEDNMPTFSVYWGESVPIVPRGTAGGRQDPDVVQAISSGYGDTAMDVPVNSALGRHIIEYMIENDFDVAHFNYIKDSYGGSVGRRYPRADGELGVVRTSPPINQGLPHGYAFVVTRLFENQPRPIVPVFQNTCYPAEPADREAFLPVRPGCQPRHRVVGLRRARGGRGVGRPQPLRRRRRVGPDGAQRAQGEGRGDADERAAQPALLGGVPKRRTGSR